MRNRFSKLGFTLIELLIVITIIGILAVVFLPSILGAPEKARDATRQADLSNMVQAIEAARLDGKKVKVGEDVVADECASTALDDIKSYFGGGIVPTDPLKTNAKIDGCASDGEYFFDFIGTNQYAIYARMDDVANGNVKCPTELVVEDACYYVETTM